MFQRSRNGVLRPAGSDKHDTEGLQIRQYNVRRAFAGYYHVLRDVRHQAGVRAQGQTHDRSGAGRLLR